MFGKSHKYGILITKISWNYREKDNRPGNVSKTKKRFNVKI